LSAIKDEKANMPPSEPPVAPDDLPYQIELREQADPVRLERVLGRAVNVRMARAIFNAAINEHPGRRITLSRGDSLIADSDS
jgi:hypothetical protein